MMFSLPQLIEVYHLTLCMLGNFSYVLSSSDYILFFKFILIQESHQSVKQFGSRSGLLSGLIWVQTVCKGYQQTALVNKEFSRRDNIDPG